MVKSETAKKKTARKKQGVKKTTVKGLSTKKRIPVKKTHAKNMLVTVEPDYDDLFERIADMERNIMLLEKQTV